LGWLGRRLAVSETDLQRSIIDGLERIGFWCMRINSGRKGGVMMAPKGTPDILVLCPYIWLEVKLPDGKLSPEQQAFEERAKKEAIPHAVVRSLSEAVSVVRGASMVESRQRYEVIQDALDRLTGRGL
jgi:hypothetical protein